MSLMTQFLYRFLGLAGVLGWRYARATTANRFIRFISASSVIGIALGCAVLILVLSAMNGFESELKNRLLSVVPHIEFTAVEKEGLSDWQQSIEKLEQHPAVIAAAPFVKFNGMLQKGSQLKPIAVTGIDWQLEANVSTLADYIEPAQWAGFKQNGGMILGQGIAEQLQLNIGDRVEVLIPKISTDFKLSAPKVLRLPLVATFKMGGQLDYLQAYIPMQQAAKVTGWDQGVQGLRVKIDDVFNANQWARTLGYDLPYYVYISSWTREYGHLYNDIQLVRTVMYVILALVIAVACFNIVSTLVMAVNEKAGDIAILKTMGASSHSLIKTFMLQGFYNGLVGVLSGCSIGVILSLYLSDIMRSIETAFGMTFLSGDVYFIDFLPTLLNINDVVITAIVAMVMSLLATLYPAYRATQLQPAQVL